MERLYDPKCYRLAERFLQDEPTLNTEELRDALAFEIQCSIEDFIEAYKNARRLKPKTAPPRPKTAHEILGGKKTNIN